MPRIECPACGTPDRVDDRDLGKEWECRRCRTAYTAEPVAPPPDRRPPPRDANGRGAALSSLLLGLASILTAVCNGAGVMFALGGLVTGFGGLRSRHRGMAVCGLVLSTAGLVLSAGALALFAIVRPEREIPARQDDTKPPFARGAD